jgi:hypothetical protein
VAAHRAKDLLIALLVGAVVLGAATVASRRRLI